MVLTISYAEPLCVAEISRILRPHYIINITSHVSTYTRSCFALAVEK